MTWSSMVMLSRIVHRTKAAKHSEFLKDLLALRNRGKIGFFQMILHHIFNILCNKNFPKIWRRFLKFKFDFCARTFNENTERKIFKETLTRTISRKPQSITHQPQLYVHCFQFSENDNFPDPAITAVQPSDNLNLCFTKFQRIHDNKKWCCIKWAIRSVVSDFSPNSRRRNLR